jgi:2-deoxy-D-gluconate 3-dehydrogenase
LVNNAGMTIRRPLASFDLASWRRVLDVNLTGCFVAAQAAAPLMPNGTGRIINVASILSLLARPGVAAYVATKTGLAGLTRALAVELAPAGVTVNAIAPGYIRTEMTEGLQADTAFDAQVRRRVPMARWGEPADISGAAVFLASDAARYLTGQLIAIDGGLVTAL